MIGIRTGTGEAAVVADALVIGAGIIGAACAAALAATGMRVIVLERESAPATGSSGRSAAGIRVQFSEPVNVRLSAESLREYRGIAAAMFRPIGYLFLVPRESWAAQCEAARMQQASGHEVRVLTTNEARRIVDFDPDGLAGATWCADDGIVDPHGLTSHYLARARGDGASLRLDSEVLAVERSAIGWRLSTRSGRCEAPVLINAAGAWAGRVGALAGLDVPVTPARRMVFATSPAGGAWTHPLTVDLATGLWFRSDQRRLLIGRSNPGDTGFSEGMDWSWLDQVIEPGLRRFPWFERLAIDRRASWWGYYEVTPDNQPLIGERAEAPGWFDACGFSGHGVQQAGAVGRLLSLLVRGVDPGIDLGPLQPNRFDAPPARGAGERMVV